MTPTSRRQTMTALRYLSRSGTAAALVLLGGLFGSHRAEGAEPAAADADNGAQVLTRGPVHEAFAETITFNPTAGIVVPKAPPAAIEELPPDQRPEGANVQWIPGYWGWDDERSDFLWVSGTWRALPPGRQWEPGYWAQTANGYQWTSGYWADAKATEVEFLPQPPASVESGPNVEAPAEDQSWIPGCWAWRQSRYSWRPGYWATMRPDWTWIPDHYVWTPRGYLAVGGYWDYSVARRGALFAPVFFAAGISARPGFYYSPATLINPGVFANQLFLRPGYQHYYFGDYYAASYATAGFYPWFSYNAGRWGYDPFCAQQRWENRRDRNWQHGLQAEFQNRRDHQDARPPRTLAAQMAITARDANSGRKTFVVAASLDQVAKSKDSPLRFQPIDKQERQRLAKDGQAVQTFGQDRQKLETRTAPAAGGKTLISSDPVRVKRPASPIVASSTDRPGKDQISPKPHDVLKPPANTAPTPKLIRTPEQPPAKVQPEPKQPPRTTIRPPADTTRPQPGGQPQPKGDQPRGDQPKVDQPRIVPPGAQPKPAPREPKPVPPAAVPKDAPPREPKDTPRAEPNDKPQRDSNDRPGGDARDKLKK